MERESLITPAVVAQRLDVSENFLAQLRYKGMGPTFVKVGRSVRYRMSDVEEWIEQRTYVSTSASA